MSVTVILPASLKTVLNDKKNYVQKFWLKNKGSRTHKFVGKGDAQNLWTSLQNEQQWFNSVFPWYNKY